MNEHQIGIYLNELRENRGMELKARKAAGISLADIVRERQRNESFVEQEQEIMAYCGELIRQEVWRRGYDGIDKNVYFKGEVIATEKQYSDSLLLALAKAHDSRFVEKKVVTGNNNGPIKIEIADFSDSFSDSVDLDNTEKSNAGKSNVGNINIEELL
ncbi:MAG: hypothetical protein NC080_07530 [Paraprevotella sp.]|nr:hypothetical protein [Paraprevotella sp.]